MGRTIHETSRTPDSNTATAKCVGRPAAQCTRIEPPASGADQQTSGHHNHTFSAGTGRRHQSGVIKIIANRHKNSGSSIAATGRKPCMDGSPADAVDQTSLVIGLPARLPACFIGLSGCPIHPTQTLDILRREAVPLSLLCHQQPVSPFAQKAAFHLPDC